MIRPTMITLVCLAVVLHTARAGRDLGALLELVDGGYENLLIGINERVPEDPALLQRIKFVFTKASRFLYQATNQRAYFKDVHILVPESWSASNEYANVAWQRYDQSDIIIDTPSESSGTRPYTNKPTPCGQPGFYIQLTPDYILSQNIANRYGQYDKVLVHEWAHYRWGVFDEYPLEGGQHFYADSNGNIEAVRCVLDIPGELVNPRLNGEPCDVGEDGIPEEDCRFRDDVTATGFTGSLMYKQFLRQISTFCEESGSDVPTGNVHNSVASNMQNRLCEGKSIWKVMLEHRDFAPNKGENNAANGDAGSGTVSDPRFTVVKKRTSRLVLVLDQSGSMKGQRLRQLRQAAERLISEILVNGEQLGVVVFNRIAYITSNLSIIDDANRQVLLKSLPTRANDATSIGAGIVSGLEVLSDGTPGNEAGGKLLVITDGEENTAPYIEDIIHLVNGSYVTIDTIAIGQEVADNLELLSSITGGMAFLHMEESNSLSGAFRKAATAEKALISQPMPLHSDFVHIQAGNSFSGAISVDSTIGSDTQFLFGYSLDDRAVTVVITDPDGDEVTEASDGYVINTDFMQIRVSIADKAKIGLWKFEVWNNHAVLQENVTITIQSRARGDEDPIKANAQWGLEIVTPPEKQSLYVIVGRGYTPILNSDVVAYVDTPCGQLDNETVTLRPKDDGAGADVQKDDGAYSAYFTEFCGEGRYGVNLKVTNNGEVTTIALGYNVGVGAAADPSYTGEEGATVREPTLLSTGNFSRVITGGSFKCNGSVVCSGTEDVYPPSRVIDLTATNVHVEKLEVTLRFTAPGDDLTQGKASYYIIVVSKNFSELFDNFNDNQEIPEDSYVVGDVNVTKNAGETEEFVIRVKDVGEFSYSFAVVAVDDEDNHGEPSNIATSSARDFRALPLGLIIGVTVGGALLLIIVVVLAVCLVRKMRGGTKKAVDGATTQGTAMNSYNNNGMSIEEGRQEPKPNVRGKEGAVQSSCDPLYDSIISHKGQDPNWDPTLANNSQGGGANIRRGHVSGAVNMFEKSGVVG